MIEFKSIRSIEDINKLISRLTSDDGESLNFELKGTNGDGKFSKHHKNNLAKEICAFTNTYGGILCFHNGNGSKIEPFEELVSKSNFNPIESWLKDSLEPRLLGIDIKLVDGIFIINIPESKTKPHRTNGTSEYYYRHSTISQRMPEIMISSMYRSQDYLSFSVSNFLAMKKNVLSLFSTIENHSNIAGTKPKIDIQILGNIDLRLTFFENKFAEVNPKIFLDKKENEIFKEIVSISSNTEFKEQILYPKDKIVFPIITQPNNEINKLNFILIRLNCMFKQSIKYTKHSIYKKNDKGELELFKESDDEKYMQIDVEYFIQLMKDKNK